MDALEFLGRRLCRARTRRGLSIEQVAEVTSFDAKTLAACEAGADMSASDLAHLADLYSVTADWLTGVGEVDWVHYETANGVVLLIDRAQATPRRPGE